MKLKKSSRRSIRSLKLLDAQMDSFLRWRAESTSAVLSYRDWQSASRTDRAIAFRTYVAALEREEIAARAYRRTLEQVASPDYYHWS